MTLGRAPSLSEDTRFGWLMDVLQQRLLIVLFRSFKELPVKLISTGEFEGLNYG